MHVVMRGTGIRQAKVLPRGLQLLGFFNYTAQCIVLDITAPIADVTQAIADGTHENLARASPLTLTTDQTSQDTDCGDAPFRCCGSPCAYSAACLCSVQDKTNDSAAVHLSGRHLR